MTSITIILSMIIGVLLLIVFFLDKRYKYKVKETKYIHEKLGSIIQNDTNEKLMILTGDNETKELLIQINRLLEMRQRITANYIKNEASMKKMLSNISHDLKTPLTVVLGYIETMQFDDNISVAETKTLLSKVHGKAMEVIELINKFFDLAKLESGDKDIPITRININEVCRKSILEFYDILTTKKLKVEIDIPEATIYVLGNEEALKRILNNLISNAINYGSAGNVIGLCLRCDENDETVSYIDVWDRGKGISELNEDRVFERLFTLEDSRNRLYQGSGLGLTITKRLVEKMGGEILLKSTPYEKTIFTVKLKMTNY